MKERSDNSETGYHEPRWRFDCSRCKFSWCCGPRCACNVRKDVPPPPERLDEMALEVLRASRIYARARLGTWWGLDTRLSLKLERATTHRWRVTISNESTKKKWSGEGDTIEYAWTVAKTKALLSQLP